MIQITFNPKLSANFHIREFACNDGTDVPWDLIPNAQRLAKNLQALRDEIGRSISANSVYRNPTYNKSIGGSPNSQHMLCLAADIPAMPGYSPTKIAATIEKLIAAGKMEQGGIGIYNTFCHYDCRLTKARW